MRRTVLSAALTASLAVGFCATPVLAAQEDKAITDRDPNAMDVAKTPITDLNVGRDNEIPPLLMAAVAEPYKLDGLAKCHQIASAIGDLDQVLGPDVDLPQEQRDRINAGRVGKWVVASFIPFRGLIREVSGANEQDRRVNAAIQAGLTRRGFLKGVGAAKGCRYPASPAPAEIVQARMAELEARDKKPRQDKRAKAAAAQLASDDRRGTQGKDNIAFKSEPDVKQTPPQD